MGFVMSALRLAALAALAVAFALPQEHTNNQLGPPHDAMQALGPPHDATQALGPPHDATQALISAGIGAADAAVITSNTYALARLQNASRRVKHARSPHRHFVLNANSSLLPNCGINLICWGNAIYHAVDEVADFAEQLTNITVTLYDFGECLSTMPGSGDPLAAILDLAVAFGEGDVQKYLMRTYVSPLINRTTARLEGALMKLMRLA